MMGEEKLPGASSARSLGKLRSQGDAELRDAPVVPQEACGRRKARSCFPAITLSSIHAAEQTAGIHECKF